MARHRADALGIDPSTTDAALAIQVTAGSLVAFEELYRRHAQAAWRVAQSVTGNAEDAADAVSEAFVKVLKAVVGNRLHDAERFRSYLLTASRNAALDVHRGRGRVQPTDAAEVFDGPTSDRGPSDVVVDGADRDMVARAFRSLPERWRSVLWLTEVEGIPPREAAGMLGVSANGVAQLAVRARAGLRERFLQAHLRDRAGDVDDACRFTVERLGASVAGALSPRDLAKVDQHLAGCASCRARREELEDLGPSLRRVVIPFPIGLAALSLGKWQAAAATGAVGTAGAAAGGGGGMPAWIFKAQRPLAVASVGLFAAGIVGVGVVGQSGTGLDDVRRRVIEGQAFSAPEVTFTPAAAVAADGVPAGGPSPSGDRAGGTTGDDTSSSSSDELARGDSGGDGEGGDDGGPSTTNPTVPPATTTTLPSTGTTTTTTAPPPSTTTTTALAQLNVYATTGSTSAKVSAGGCTGISTGSTTTGCTAPTPAGDDTVVVEGNAPVVGYIPRQAI